MMLVVGGVASPVAALVLVPEGRWARHGLEMFLVLGKVLAGVHLMLAIGILTMALVGLARLGRGVPGARAIVRRSATTMIVFNLGLGGCAVGIAPRDDGFFGQAYLLSIGGTAAVALVCLLAVLRSLRP
ncbi:MAG TPA: hypothetical protein VF062_01600 [Candidatus Limnocylindrales bacterium]